MDRSRSRAQRAGAERKEQSSAQGAGTKRKEQEQSASSRKEQE